MEYLVTWMIGLPMLVGISWAVWYYWNSSNTLDERIRNGDLELLNSPNYKITEVVRAPLGSSVEKVASQVIVPNGGNFVQQSLSDGNIALIPVNSIPRPVRSDPQSTHTSHQLQELLE